MNNDTIGTATVKITADISDLKEKIEQAKNVSKGLDNFKIRAGEDFSGNWEEYQQYIAKTNAEYEQYIANQASAVTATEQLNTAMTEIKPAVDEASDSVAKFAEAVDEKYGKGFYDATKNMDTFSDSMATLKDKITHPLQTIQASFSHTKDTIEQTSRMGRVALIGLATAMTAYAKSSIEEYAKYNQTAYETQQRLNESSTRLKLTIGQLLQPVVQAISGIMEWVSQNRALVSGLLTFAGVLAGSAGIIALVHKLKAALVALKVAGGGIVGLISVLAGLAVGVAVSNMEFEDYNETLEDAKKREDELTNATETYNDAIADMNKQIADAQEGIAKATRSYRQSLKKILVDHEKTVNELTQQIKDANTEYNRAIEERNAEFALSMQEEEEEHQKKVDELTTQIDFLQRYNNKYNKEKLEQLKFALAKENNRYKEHTALMKEELDIQNQAEKEKLDERVNEYQKSLEEEQKFLSKHRDVLNSVRDEILDDEVEALTRQHQETLKGYNEAIETARQKGYEAGQTWAKALQDASSQVRSAGQQAGNNYVSGFGDMLWQGLQDLGKQIREWAQPITNLINGVVDKMTGYQGKAGMSAKTELEGIVKFYKETYGNKWKSEWVRQGMGEVPQGYARGGYTGQGAENEIAGIVHKGEYVLPQDMVDQTTGTPKAMGNTFNINVSGVFATSAMERRKVANDIINAINQTNYARLGA